MSSDQTPSASTGTATSTTASLPTTATSPPSSDISSSSAPPPTTTPIDNASADGNSKASPEEIARKVLEEHDAKLFRAPRTNRPISLRDIEVPDSFFEPTASELTHVFKKYSEHTDALANATMKTKKMRQAEEDERMSRFRHVLIRIQFPDRVMLQGVFKPKSTIRQVRRFVRAALLHARDVPFYFFVTPPKQILTDMDVTLWSQRLVPKALIHIGFDDDAGVNGTMMSSANSKMRTSVTLLKPLLTDVMTDAPETLTDATSPPPPHTVTTLSGDQDSAAAARKDNSNKDKSKLMKKVPKWFSTKK